jgi:serine/threonine protein phosphatase PrpC
MDIRIAGRTDVGRTRSRNEDALLQRPGRGIVAVADGMGGHAAGDIASRLAVDVLDDRTADLPGDGIDEYLKETVRAAHDAILRAAAADPALDGMGTTLTALHLDRGSGTATIVHVGDSRAYRWRNAALEQLTRDQTWVQEQVDSGRLSPEQARGHPFSAMLTSALGVAQSELDTQVIAAEVEPGDLFVLCSDGLTARLTDEDLRRLLLEHDGLDDVADAMVAAANEAGGPDNITVALVRIVDE